MKHDWTKIRRALRSEAPPAPRPAADFWASFREQAAQAPRLAPVPLTPPASTWHHRAQRALALAATIALLAVAGVWWHLSRPPAALAPGNGGMIAAAPAEAMIQHVEVAGNHTGIMILSDGPRQGTLLWVSGLQP